jgi:hypothetical protein
MGPGKPSGGLSAATYRAESLLALRLRKGVPTCCSPLRNNFSRLQANHLTRLASRRSEGEMATQN